MLIYKNKDKILNLDKIIFLEKSYSKNKICVYYDKNALAPQTPYGGEDGMVELYFDSELDRDAAFEELFSIMRNYKEK